MSDFPKYQYSVFLKNGRDQQLVIRADTFEDLVEAKKNIDKIFEVSEAKTEELAKEFVSSPAPLAPAKAMACATCGQPANEKQGTNRNGKPYHAIFCSSEDKTHTRWL